ncbi:MAG: NUDIX hydrolase [Candidatus Eremiobacterota bacterium]
MKDKWTFLTSHVEFTDRILKIRHDRYLFNEDNTEKDYTVIDTCDWVNILPVTEDGMVILIKQYRHGTGEDVIEIPGGVIEGKDISPEIAARRELLEETGYSSAEFINLGTVRPNPAIQNNKCYMYLARNAFKSGCQSLDSHEEIDLFFVPKKEIAPMICSGKINHSLVIDAFCLLMLYEGKEI